MIPNKLTITLPEVYNTTNKVEVIKAIRMLTDCSLKEAKDISEVPGPVALRVNIVTRYTDGSSSIAFKNAVNLLKANGVEVVVNSMQEGLIKDIRNLACTAILKDEIAVAKVLLEALEKVDQTLI